jgi:hypothetical protein
MIPSQVYRDNIFRIGRKLGEFDENGTKFFVITTSPTQHPTALITAPAEGWIPVDDEYVSKEFERELDSIIRRYKFLGLDTWDIDAILDAKSVELFTAGAITAGTE